MKVVVTIPAYNEEKTLGKVIKGIKDILRNSKFNCSILVVDDGSKDKTREVAKDSGAIVFSHPSNYGLAETFRTEIRRCLDMKADIIVHTDADGQYSAKDIPRLLSEIEKGHDLVLGSRFKGKIESMPFMKRLGNIAFSKTISGILRYRISDAQTGFRAFTREVAQNIKIDSDFTYTQEQIIKAVRHKYSIKEIPVYFAKRPGKSRLMSGPLHYAARAWVNIIRVYRDFAPLKFFGLIGGLLLALGVLIGIWLVSLFFTQGFIGKTPSLILSMLLIVVGIQIISFGLLADMNRR